MRKYSLAAAITVAAAAAAQAQTPQWFVSASTGAGWGGPKGSIKKTLIKNSFNHTSYLSFLGWEGKTEYPIVYSGVPVLLKAGKKVKENKSVYLLGGIA
ncbi:MAG: hypothetical protein ACO1NX_04575, partial [Chitinophagaceae bacterium]